MFGWRDMREGIEGGGGEKFYLGVFFKWDEEGFEGIRRGKIPSKPLIFYLPKFKSFWGGEEVRGVEWLVVTLILKIFKLSSLLLWCPFLLISLKLIIEDYNDYFIWSCYSSLLPQQHPNKRRDIHCPPPYLIFKTFKQRE